MAVPYISISDKCSELLSVMLFISHGFFCGFGGSSRLDISNMTSVGKGLALS